MNEKPIWQSKKLIMSLVGVVAGWLANYLDMNPLEVNYRFGPSGRLRARTGAGRSGQEQGATG